MLPEKLRSATYGILGGWVTVTYGSDLGDPPITYSVQYMPDGGCVVSGYSYDGSLRVSYVAYLNSNGSIRSVFYDDVGGVNSTYLDSQTMPSGENVTAGWVGNTTCLLSKRDSEGAIDWQKGFSFISGTYSEFERVTIDGSGNVYVQGWSSNTPVLLASYDSSGNLLWQVTNVSGANDRAYDVAALSNCTVLVGILNSSSAGSIILFNQSTGAVTYKRRISGAPGSAGIYKVCQNSLLDTGFYTVGIAGISAVAADGYCGMLGKYTTTASANTMTQVWSKLLKTSITTNQIELREVACLSDGSVCYAGRIQDNVTAPTVTQALIIRVDASGNLVWARELPDYSYVYEMSVDSDDNLFVGVVFEGATLGLVDSFQKLNANEDWIGTFDGIEWSDNTSRYNVTDSGYGLTSYTSTATTTTYSETAVSSTTSEGSFDIYRYPIY